MTETTKLSAGDVLKQGRLRQRLSIAECVKRTHISARYLDALEADRWTDLPSESHRIGFLKLYSQFLGISIDEVLNLYHRPIQPPAEPSADAHGSASPAAKSRQGWYPTSVGQVVAIVLLALAAIWGLYHAFGGNMYESKATPWVRLRPLKNARLVTSRAVVSTQKIRIIAESDSWIRLSNNAQLLYEGILPAQATKEWTGTGTYALKMSDPRALHVFWNDQPVDAPAATHGSATDLQLPLHK
ncbi:MAG TPA: RodZ domain-containing protein [Elusimicrobiota bacterium]|nr:RodZ domain-containing protein [Elusimicrobiota bacterium]